MSVESWAAWAAKRAMSPDDAAQQVRLAALEAAGRGLPHNGIMDACRWSAYDAVRVRGSARARSTDIVSRGGHAHVGVAPASTPPSPEDSVIGADLAAWVRSRLADLPPREAEVLRLRFFEGLSVAATMRRLAVSRRVLNYRIQRSIDRLRRYAWIDGVRERRDLGRDFLRGT